MYTFPVHNKTVSVFSSAKPGTPVIYLNTFSNEGQQVFQTAQDAGCPPFTLVAVSDLNWNHDMTPWDSPSVFKNAPPCTGGGNDYIRLLIEEIMPEAEKKIATYILNNQEQVMERNCRILSGGSVRRLLHLSNRYIFPGGQRIRLPLVSGNERVCLFP